MKRKMKAVYLAGLRRLEMREAPAPEIKAPDEVLLKVEQVGVCGSDVHYYTTGRIGSMVVKFPFRLGHEFSATVAGVGKKVKHLKPGDRVAVEPAISCGKCDQCRAGRRHTCRKLRFLGCPGQAEGCLCEYIVMREKNCFKVPGKMSFEQAALVEPLSIGIYSSKLAMPLKGKTVGILGFGPIGISVFMSSLSEGAQKIYVTDKIDERLKTAKKAGASWVGNPKRTDITGEIVEKEPSRLDIVFECCGQQEALDQAVDLLKPGGKLLIVGIPEVERISFKIDVMRRKELQLLNVRRQNNCVEQAIRFMSNQRGNMDFMITHRFSLERTQEAFDLVAGYKDGVIKAMINAGGS